MTPISFSRRVQKLFSDNSWVDNMVRTLSCLPIPYWATCWLIGFIILIGNYIFSIQDEISLLSSQGDLQTLSLWLIVFIGFATSFLIPYSLYILWYLENISQNTLHDLKLIKKETIIPNNAAGKTAKSRNKVFLTENLIFLGLTIYGTRFLIVYEDILFSMVLISIPLFITISAKIIKITTVIYNLNSKSISINIFDLYPLYQLSQLTQKIALLLFPYSIMWLIIGFKTVGSVRLSFGSIFEFLLSIILLIITFSSPITFLAQLSIFLLPIIWIRKKIIETKNDILSDLGATLRELFEKQDKFAKAGDYSKVIELKEYLNILIARKEYIQKISEYPWESRILSEFLAAFLFPFILWMSQFFLTRWVAP